MSGSFSDHIYRKYEWAQEQVQRFEVAVDKVRTETPFGIKSSINESAGTVTFYVDSVPDLPVNLPLLLGDAIHNLRSTLDHIAYALVTSSGGAPNKRTCFPVFDDFAKYQDGVRACLPNLGIRCMMDMDNMQPYKRGFGHWVWQLHQLDIVDKHRLLLAVAVTNVSRTRTKAETEMMGTADYPLVLSPSDLRPLAVGDELARFPRSEVGDKMGFSFDIALDEPGIVSCYPTFLLLRYFSGEVFRTIQRFEIYLYSSISTSPANHP